jgi:hypothetical protein
MAKYGFETRSFPLKCCQCFFTRFWDARSGIRLQLRKRFFFSPKLLDRLPGPRRHLLNGCRGIFPEIKLPMRVVNHSPSVAKVKNGWSSTSSPPCTFTPWTGEPLPLPFYRAVGRVYVTGLLVMNLVLCEQSFPTNITAFETIRRAPVARPRLHSWRVWIRLLLQRLLKVVSSGM